MGLFDFDHLLQGVISAQVALFRLKHRLGWQSQPWQPGQPLKLLLVGYNGAGNTGSDVRVTEIIRQIRHILGPHNVEFTLMVFNKQLSAGYFPHTRQIPLPLTFVPKFLLRESLRHHGVVACEGSMFKSNFTDVVPTIMAGALGMAGAEAKLGVGYGAEAGPMSPNLRHFVMRHCQNSLILSRNEASRGILNKMGLRVTSGTDTAWTFEPAPRERGIELLRAAGWDGRRQILVVCPINPFWWPVKLDFRKLAWRYLTGQYKDYQYYLTHFHHRSPEAIAKYTSYIKGMANAIRAFSREFGVFTVIIGMDRLDRAACKDLAAQLSPSPPCFISGLSNIYDLVSLLQNSTFVVSSRYHALVNSMPTQVPSIGVTMDERIRNLMIDRCHAELLLEVDDPHLDEKLLYLLRRLCREREALAAEIGDAVACHLRQMGQMGFDFMNEVTRVYPDFPRPDRPGAWDAYLPPLPGHLERLLSESPVQ